MKNETINPYVFLCLILWLIVLVIFIVWRCNKMKKELNDYMDEKLNDFKLDAKINFDKLQNSINEIKDKDTPKKW